MEPTRRSDTSGLDRSDGAPDVTAGVGSRAVPSVDKLARSLMGTGLPHPLLVDIARLVIERHKAGGIDPKPIEEIAAEIAHRERRRLLQPVVNATGVLLHTNLGRAPLGFSHTPGYTNLEFNLDDGRRGDRSDHAGRLLAKACGAEAATVVNNGAAAVLLALSVLAAGREVIVSRGELVEIGGGFRVPDVMQASGADLVEVGTTNRTRLDDYKVAVSDRTAVLLKVHTSNFRISGFTESTSIRELATLGPPVIADLGSGFLDSRCQWLAGGPPQWLRGEPAVFQSIEEGAALVTFSGDKLLGGPQAGVIAGRTALVDACKRHPLSRALRPGALILEALQATVMAYLRREAFAIPLWRMATASVDDLAGRAAQLGVGQVVTCESVMGGGTLPGAVIPSAGVAIDGDITYRLRASTPPVVARVVDSRTLCDLRTVLPEQDAVLAAALEL